MFELERLENSFHSGSLIFCFIISVGSFIVSWIRNLKTTADPKKAHKKYFYGNIKSKNKFSADIRQFSQNYHFSQIFPSLNSGYSIDANVIFSSTSYVPRATSLNLDTSLFGNTVNLFGVRKMFMITITSVFKILPAILGRFRFSEERKPNRLNLVIHIYFSNLNIGDKKLLAL